MRRNTAINRHSFWSWAFGAFLFLLLAGCNYKVEEKQRLPNEKSTVDAVLAIKLTDATVFTPTEIYVLPKDQPIEGEPVFRASRTEAVEMSWKEESVLLIKAKSADVFLQKHSLDLELPSGKEMIRIEYDIDAGEPLSSPAP